MSLFIIGEMGSCHDGDLAKALRLVAVAAEAKCDAIKGQFWSDGKLLAARRKANQYAAVYDRYAMPERWLELLARHSAEFGIEFLCTAYMPQDLAIVAPHVKRFKVASFEARDHEFLTEHNRYPQPVVLSTGMMTMLQTVDAVRALRHIDAVLHCCSAYPAPDADLNLGAIRALRETFRFYMGARIGFSDHTRDIVTGGLAVAAGAEVLEVHYRLDDTPPNNPDYLHSLTPSELQGYVAFARRAERMVGDGEKRIQTSEDPMAKFRVMQP